MNLLEQVLLVLLVCSNVENVILITKLQYRVEGLEKREAWTVCQKAQEVMNGN